MCFSCVQVLQSCLGWGLDLGETLVNIYLFIHSFLGFKVMLLECLVFKKEKERKENNKCWRGWREMKPCVLLVGM